MNKIVTCLWAYLFSIPIHATDIESLCELEGFATPESALFATNHTKIYISNINGSPLEVDGNGYISIISHDGKMIEAQWVTGLNAPKGMAVSKDEQLYVADINTLVQIDIASGKVVNSYQDKNAKFLNDVSIDDDGHVYVSDMLTNRIHVLKDSKFTVWLDSEKLDSPNGLLAQGEYLIVGSWGKMTDGFATDVAGHLKSINIKTKEISSLGNGKAVGNLDGIEPLGDDFLVTDWMAGRLYQIDREGDYQLLLQQEQGMADLGFNEDKKLIILPMMNSNKVSAYTY